MTFRLTSDGIDGIDVLVLSQGYQKGSNFIKVIT